MPTPPQPTPPRPAYVPTTPLPDVKWRPATPYEAAMVTSPSPDRPPTVLDEAAAVVDGPRRADYGTPSENHGRTAALWSAYLGIPITARQVCMLNVLQKISRDARAAKRDNLVDIAGYVRNVEMIQADEQVTAMRRAVAALTAMEAAVDEAARAVHAQPEEHVDAD